MHNYHISGCVFKLILLWQLVNCQGQLHWQLQFTNVVNCDIKGLKLLIEKFQTDYNPPRTSLNARYRVIDDISILKKVYLHIERCNERGYDCEDFQNLRIEQCCRMMTLKNQIWSDFVSHFHPRLRCPLKKATYEVQNATADSDALITWYPGLEKYRWKVDCRITNEEDSTVACVLLEAYIQQFRKQDRKPSKKPKND